MTISRRDMLVLSVGGLAAIASPQRAFADNKEIVLGCSLPLSGPAAPTGITTQRTFEHMIELINKEGIVIGPDRYTIRPAFYDNKYVPAEAVTIVEKMLADGVRFIFSSGSGNSVPVVAKTNAAKVLQMSGASGKEHLTAPQFPLSFRVQPTNETAYAVYPWLRKIYPKINRVAHLDPSDEAGFTEAEDRTNIAAKNGFTNVGKEFFKRGSSDFYPAATRILESKPELIDFGGTIGRDQGLACKALRELGYTGLIMLGYSDAKSFIEIAGPDAAEGTLLFDTLVDPQMPAQKELREWWLQKYGPPFPSFAYSVGDTPSILAIGMRKAQSVDPVKIAEAMHGMHWEGLYGPEAFDMKSVYGIATSITRAIPMAVVKGGKPVQLAIIPWPQEA